MPNVTILGPTVLTPLRSVQRLKCKKDLPPIMNSFLPLKNRPMLAAGLALAALLNWQVRGAAVDFVKDVQPILELNCVSCHNPAHAHENGELDLSTRGAALKGGDHNNDLVPGN